MRLRRAIFHCARSCVCGGGGCLDRRRRCRTLAGAHRKLGRRTDKPLTERSDALCGCSRYGCAGSLACGEFGCSSVYRSVCAATWRAGMERIVRTRRGNAHVRCGIACRSGTGCGCVGCTDCACVCVDCPTGTHASCVGGDGAFRWANRSGYDALFVNAGPLRWVARNASKPARAGVETWLLHATAEWSQTHGDATPANVIASLSPELAALGLPMPQSCDAFFWTVASSAPALQIGCAWDAQLGLGMCGDWMAGGKVEGAWQSGVALARCVSADDVPRSGCN